MRTAGTDAVGMLRWGLRRYRLLFLVCLLVGAGLAPLVVLQRQAPTDAEAAVIATRLDMNLIALPRYGEAVFNDGRVAKAVAGAYPELGSVDGMIPSHVSLNAEQDSIVFQVVGHDADPDRAAEIANVAAEAFVGALNEAGVGVGTFALQSEAEPPAEPDNPLSTVFAIPVGLVAGLLLALAAVGVLLVVRRPVIDGKDAEEATGIPSLGTVTVPRTPHGVTARPDAFPGLIPVCRRLLGLPTPTIVLISRPQDEDLRSRLTPAVASVLGRVREVQVVGPSQLAGSVSDERTGRAAPGTGDARAVDARAVDPGAVDPGDMDPNAVDTEPPGRLTVIDSSDPLDLVHPPELTATVLVVREGIRSAALRDAVVEHLGGSAEARLLMVRRGSRLRRASGVAAAPEATGRRDVATARAR
jgi:hypothetical protein